MNSMEVAQKYFDGWNRRDADAVLATFADGGTYSDPATPGPLGPAQFAGYMHGLWTAFPDLSFEIASAGEAGEGLVAAQWIMRGTNTGSLMGMPPTGRTVEVTGADFIRIANGRIQSVTGYFDSRAVPTQLGLQVLVQPERLGPFEFGNSVRFSTGSQAKPGAFSVTALDSTSEADRETVRGYSQKIAVEMLGMQGFISAVTVTVGDRMLTVSAWEKPEDPLQVLREGTHAAAMKGFYGTEMARGGMVSTWIPQRIGPRWMRCETCGKMSQSDTGRCGCGAALESRFPYW